MGLEERQSEDATRERGSGREGGWGVLERCLHAPLCVPVPLVPWAENIA